MLQQIKQKKKDIQSKDQKSVFIKNVKLAKMYLISEKSLEGRAKQNKMFVCENPVSQKKSTRQAGNSFFSYFSKYTYKQSFQRNERNKRTVKVNKAN